MSPVETRPGAWRSQNVSQQCEIRINMMGAAKPLPEVFSSSEDSSPPPSPPTPIRPILRRHTWPAANSTPTNQSRSVHFDSGEHVRYFWKVEQPIAVGITSSPPPVPAFASESRVLDVRLALARLNFPAEIPLRGVRPVELERVWLADDPSRMLASVLVSNLGYHKDVVCRFTFDGWRTSNEVSGVYVGNNGQGYDRFMLTVYPSGCSADPTGRVFELCFRYCVNGETFWDNNRGENYQLFFHRAVVMQPSGTDDRQTKSTLKRGMTC